MGFAVRADANNEPASHSVPSYNAAEMIAAIDLQSVDVVGIMHSRIHVTGAALDALQSHWQGPTAVYPDSGYFKMPHWQFDSVMKPTPFTQSARPWFQREVRILGGCCGLGVNHIQALAMEFEIELHS